MNYISSLSLTESHSMGELILAKPEETLKTLGFVKVLEYSGEPLDSVLHKRCQERYLRSKEYKRELVLSSRDARLSTQLWQHPDGIIAWVVNGYKSHSDVSKVSFMAILQTDFIENGRNLIDGRRIKIINQEVSKYQSLTPATFFKEFIEARNAGNALSIKEWAVILSDPIIKNGINDDLLPVNLSIDFAQLALDWNGKEIKTLPTQTPFIINDLLNKNLLKYREEIKSSLLISMANQPSDIRHLIITACDKGLDNLQDRIKKNIKKNTKKRWKSFVMDMGISYVQKKALSPGITTFTPHQREVIKSWLEEFVNPTKASARRWVKLPEYIPGTQISRLELVMSFPQFGGIQHKIFQEINSASDIKLAQWCKGEGLPEPLALMFAHVMLHTKNRPYQDDTLERMDLIGKIGLLTISNRLGDQALLWDGPRGNVWSRAAGQLFNLPIDDDLVHIQKKRNVDFLDFVQQFDTSLPKEIRFVAEDMEDNVWCGTPEVFDASLLDYEDFAQVWNSHAREFSRKAHHYWGVLSHVVAYVKNKALEEHVGERWGEIDAVPRFRPKF